MRETKRQEWNLVLDLVIMHKILLQEQQILSDVLWLMPLEIQSLKY